MTAVGEEIDASVGELLLAASELAGEVAAEQALIAEEMQPSTASRSTGVRTRVAGRTDEQPAAGSSANGHQGRSRGPGDPASIPGSAEPITCVPGAPIGSRAVLAHEPRPASSRAVARTSTGKISQE